MKIVRIKIVKWRGKWGECEGDWTGWNWRTEMKSRFQWQGNAYQIMEPACFAPQYLTDFCQPVPLVGGRSGLTSSSQHKQTSGDDPLQQHGISYHHFPFFPFRGCVSPSHTNAEACFRAGPMRNPTDVWCCVAPIAATDGACMYVLRYPALSLVQARRIGW